MATNIKVVLFEDLDRRREKIHAALRRRLGQKMALPFDLKRSPNGGHGTYEERISAMLSRPPYKGVTLIVADRDLSGSNAMLGLSFNAVIAAAKTIAVPVCDYAREPRTDDSKWRTRWEEGRMSLSISKGDDEFARQVAVIARGFAMIADRLSGVMAVKGNRSPVKILAALLGKPEYADKIALYSVGDQNRLAEISPEDPKGQERSRMVTFLGHWLWDSLLRYPGLLVNEVAAASHLNIATSDFRKHNVQGLFKKALYRGPFADSKRPHWWRGMLDDIVANSKHASGLELAQKKLGPGIKRSKCCVDSSKTAGYYCIISERPVSLENSKGGLSWFPRGADLARISEPTFAEYGPWLA